MKTPPTHTDLFFTLSAYEPCILMETLFIISISEYMLHQRRDGYEFTGSINQPGTDGSLQYRYHLPEGATSFI